MSNDVHAANGVSLVQKVVILLGGIIAPIFVIYTITRSPELPAPKAKVAAVDRSEVVKNIEPLAQVEEADASEETAVVKVKTGEEIVNQACAACHASGAMGSPKLGDAGAWSARIALGYETLTKHAIEGIRMMPPRGGNSALTDNDIAKAVAYMANKAGADFKAPEADAAE